jgi:hypothetical protein
MEPASTWSPPQILNPKQVELTNVAGDGNCLFYCLLQGDENVKQVMDLRRSLMNYLTEKRHDQIQNSPYTWEWWTMNAINDRNDRARAGDGIGWIPISSFEEYTTGMLNSTPNAPTTMWGDYLEILLYAIRYQQNVAVYQTIDGKYQSMEQYPFGANPSISSNDWHLLFRTSNHYMILTVETTSERREAKPKQKSTHRDNDQAIQVIHPFKQPKPVSCSLRMRQVTPYYCWHPIWIRIWPHTSTNQIYIYKSLFCHYCPMLNRSKKRKQSIITGGEDDDTDNPKDTVLALERRESKHKQKSTHRDNDRAIQVIHPFKQPKPVSCSLRKRQVTPYYCWHPIWIRI